MLLLAKDVEFKRAIGSLSKLNLSHNPITGGKLWDTKENGEPIFYKEDSNPKAMLYVSRSIINAKALLVVNLSNCGVGTEGICAFCGAIDWKTIQLKILNLSNNPLFRGTVDLDKKLDKDQSGWDALCSSVADSSLEKLSVANVGMGPVGLSTFLKLFSSKTKLSRNLKYLALSSTADKACEYVLQSNTAKLDLAERGFSAYDCEFLSVVLMAKSRIVDYVQAIFLAKNPCIAGWEPAQMAGRSTESTRDSNTGGIKRLAEAVSCTPSIRELDLSQCELGATALFALYNSFDWEITGIRILNINLNPEMNIEINMDRFEAVCNDSMRFARLHHLDMRSLGMGPKSAECLVGMLAVLDATAIAAAEAAVAAAQFSEGLHATQAAGFPADWPECVPDAEFEADCDLTKKEYSELQGEVKAQAQLKVAQVKVAGQKAWENRAVEVAVAAAAAAVAAEAEKKRAALATNLQQSIQEIDLSKNHLTEGKEEYRMDENDELVTTWSPFTCLESLSLALTMIPNLHLVDLSDCQLGPVAIATFTGVP
jgi:hypothetical protein